MEETWKPVIGWETLYEVSDRGRVRSITRTVESYGGRMRSAPATVLVAHPVSRHGYLGVRLSGHGKVETFAVHRLVALAHLGPRPDGKTINHIDGNKKNNSVANLEYCSQAENNQHALHTGLRTNPKGSHNGSAKLTESQVAEIKGRLRAGESQAALVRAYGVSRSLISQIATGKLWLHVQEV
jgi:hypothetical protein